MAIDFYCPHCGLHTLVDEPYVGQSGPCYRCGQLIQVDPSPALAASPSQVFAIAADQRFRLLLSAIVAVGIGLALTVLTLVIRLIEIGRAHV